MPVASSAAYEHPHRFAAHGDAMVRSTSHRTLTGPASILIVLTVFFAPLLTAAMTHAQAPSPYAGQQTRTIKALAAEDVEAYLSGKGMGLAKAAELNGYPGPAHVMSYAAELQLTPSQQARTKALFESMEARAKSLGRTLVDLERDLDAGFAAGSMTGPSLSKQLQKIGAVQAHVRDVHLQAHLDQVAILTPHQVARYAELRGYSEDADHRDDPIHQHTR